MEIVKCPLCARKVSFKEVFFKDRVFAGGQIFPLKATKNRDDEGYGKGDCAMDIRQCEEADKLR